MNEKTKEFLDKNPLWEFKTNALSAENGLTKYTPIYITGVLGPQGKTTSKNLLIEDGYVNVLELEEVFNESVEAANKYLRERNKPYTDEQYRKLVDSFFKVKNAKYIHKYLNEGLVINFGKKTLATTASDAVMKG